AKQAVYAFADDIEVTMLERQSKYRKARTMEARINALTVKRNALGEIYLIVVSRQECNDIYPRAGKAVGMDFGLKHFLNLDDGSVIDSPQWYKASLNELRAAHRAVSRCQKGSRNRQRAIRNLERVYQRISNRRRDWFFKLANQLVSE